MCRMQPTDDYLLAGDQPDIVYVTHMDSDSSDRMQPVENYLPARDMDSDCSDLFEVKFRKKNN